MLQEVAFIGSLKCNIFFSAICCQLLLLDVTGKDEELLLSRNWLPDRISSHIKQND